MTAELRERTPAAAHASPTAGRLRRIALRTLLTSIAVGAFLGLGGAFGTAELPVHQRTGLMILFTVVGGCVGISCFMLVGLAPQVRARPWLNGLLAGLVMFVPMGLLSWALNGLLFGHYPSVRAIPSFIMTSLVISAFMTLLGVVLGYRYAQPAAPAAPSPAPPKFLERLPLRLRGAQVWAVEAEDHYLRLHTSKGQDLILLRLADAIAELEGVEGMQVHRSWWVARDAIEGARRSDGRATLTLKDGAQVPVSRTYAGLLRERGWI